MMTGWEVKHRQVALAGQIIDEATGRGLVGVQVHLQPEPPIRLPINQVVTASSGHYFFLDLPDGRYTLTASAPGKHYLPARATATIKRQLDGRIIPTNVSLILPPVLPSAPKNTNCHLWLTASLLTEQHHDRPLAHWPDASVHGRHATNKTNAVHKLPTFFSRWRNGRPALSFVADRRQYLELPLSGASFDHTFFVVFEQTASHKAVLIDTQKDGIQLATKQNIPPNPQIWNWVFSGSEANSQVTLYENGRVTATTAYQPQSITGSLTIGAKYTHRSRFFTGYISEIIYYNRTLTEQERQTIEKFLIVRYGLPHPVN